MTTPNRTLILASSSPRRMQLLSSIGRDFEVEAADINEMAREGERPEALVRRLAVTKALTVAHRHPGALVLGADTIVSLGMTIFGKPTTPETARQMLASLSGRKHQVFTGVAVWDESLKRGYANVAMAQVTFRSLSALDIDEYVASGEPMDKAGAYAIQGAAGRWVESFEGNLETVIGLPIDLVAHLLQRMDGFRDAVD